MSKKTEKKEKLFSKKFYFYFGGFLILAIISFLFGSRLEEFVLTDESFLKGSSLAFISLFLGLIDGFNPCAMWVLIYLITLVSELKDKKKMWLIVGTFLAASGIIYYIILSLYLGGWELAIYLGYTKGVLIIAGLFGVGSGLYFLYDYYKTRGEAVCNVGDINKRKSTIDRIKKIVHSPFTLPTFLALVFLAFSINLAEFFCSIGIPQTFTAILSAAGVGLVEKYFYITLYVITFMADDLLIFYLALKAFETVDMNKYAGKVKLIGGIVMLILGIILLFFPDLLF